MNTTAQMLISPQFWICTVLAGILINLASHYFNPKCSELFARYSKKWATRNAVLAQKREMRISLLTDNQAEQHFFLSLALDKKISAAIHLGNAILTYCFAIYLVEAQTHTQTKSLIIALSICIFIMLGAFILHFFLAVKCNKEGINIINEVGEARDRTRKLYSKITANEQKQQ